ncbi:MAG: PEP-CTERM sorting domain-containing protein [Candidatus Auribacterota bacterium]
MGTLACKRGLLICLSVMLISGQTYAAALMDGTFGSKGESGIWFDPSYDVMSPVAQISSPGINFAGANGVNAPLAQVHEFDAAISTDDTGGAGYFLTESAFSSMITLTVTPTYTDASPAQTGLPYIIQHYTISNNTASTVNNIWMMNYLNADLFRSNTENPAQRVGLLNDEQATLALLEGGHAENLIFHQYQADNTEIFFHGVMLKDGELFGADRYMIEGPGTISGGGDAVYDEIYYNGTLNFSDAGLFYTSGIPTHYTSLAEYAFAIAFNVGPLAPGEYAEIAIAMSTETGLFAEDYFQMQYPTLLIPEPATVILVCMGALSLLRKRKNIR